MTILNLRALKLTFHIPAAVAAAAGPRIPSVAAVAGETGGFYVWIVDPQTMVVARRSVELGELTSELVPVHSGLSGTEWIAISGVHQLREGMTVSRLGS